ncbi:MAG TPA: response regulator [Acidimicrobiales bacterium]|nr:response regulator [Acidimicrobiales bacterium]
MIRTVVVDDDFRVAQIHVAYVQRVEGFEVVARCHNAVAATEAVDALRPDLLLLDLYLPDEHGLDLVARLRRGHHAPVDVMVITAAKDAASVHRAMQSGALHYLLKPFTFDLFRDRLLSYACMRSHLAARPEPSQDHVDKVFAALRPPTQSPVAKGRSPHTLETVERVVATSAGGVTALQVAETSGMSRATAQRYLSHLESIGRVTIQLRYGVAGRPEHVYHWTAHS